ncbi:MAG TPA: hypothetical protein VF896_10370 [Anaerolineales bacterium]
MSLRLFPKHRSTQPRSARRCCDSLRRALDTFASLTVRAASNGGTSVRDGSAGWWDSPREKVVSVLEHFSA